MRDELISMIPGNSVIVKFLGIQRAVTEIDGMAVELSGIMTLGDVIDIVKHRYPELDIREDAVVTTVNHEKALPDRQLMANDIISFLPYIGGG